MELAGVVIPLRSFALGNQRLANALDDAARFALARQMADAVADAAGALPVVVVSSAPEVVDWAERRNLPTIADPGSLNAAAEAGREWVRSQNLDRVVIAHADLPHATTFVDVVGSASEVVIVPDQHDDGTPVLSLPVDAAFTFAYGPGSFARHSNEAERRGLTVRIVRDPLLGYDVDTPEDLSLLDTPRP